MINRLITYKTEHPLRFILLIQGIFLLCACIFSKGFGFFDDHFLIVEAAQSWADGTDYNNWLPWNQKNPEPQGHSFFYTGFHFIIFKIMQFVGIENPQTKMFLIRIMHCIFPILTVVYSYKIALKIGNLKEAFYATLAVALIWYMPFLGIRNLIEMVCIPFLFIGIYRILVAQQKNIKKSNYWVLTGFIIATAISIRLQSVLFIGGVSLVLLFQKKWIESFYFIIGILFSLLLLQGTLDIIIWGYPFAEIIAYIKYNFTHSHDFIVLGYETYFVLILGILVPPVSFYIVWGFINQWKKYLLISIPVTIFLLFHTYFPNKQERFILPILPFIILLGSIGWMRYTDNSKFWKNNIKLLRYSVAFSVIINFIFLLFFAFSYSKKAPVEAMCYLQHLPNNKHYLVEDIFRSSARQMPLFYSKNWSAPEYIDQQCSIEKKGHAYAVNEYKYFPNYVLFAGDIDIENRVHNFQNKLFPKIKFLTKIEPSNLDKIMTKLNKVNDNKPYYIYKITHTIEDKKRIDSLYKQLK